MVCRTHFTAPKIKLASSPPHQMMGSGEGEAPMDAKVERAGGGCRGNLTGGSIGWASPLILASHYQTRLSNILAIGDPEAPF